MGSVEQEQKVEDPEEEERQERIAHMPILEQCYNLMDFEAVARRVMKKTAWAYYSSAADDEIVRITFDMASRVLTCNTRLCEKITRLFKRYGSGLVCL